MPYSHGATMYRFDVTDTATGRMLGFVEATSWLNAVIEAGKRWPTFNFKVASGVPQFLANPECDLRSDR